MSVQVVQCAQKIMMMKLRCFFFKPSEFRKILLINYRFNSLLFSKRLLSFKLSLCCRVNNMWGYINLIFTFHSLYPAVKAKKLAHFQSKLKIQCTAVFSSACEFLLKSAALIFGLPYLFHSPVYFVIELLFEILIRRLWSVMKPLLTKGRILQIIETLKNRR